MISKEQIDLMFQQAMSQHRSGNLAEALRFYQQLVCVAPEHPHIWNNLGVALRQNNQIEASCVAYRQHLARHPQQFKTYGNLGNALKSLGYLKAALECHELALQHDPDDPECHYNLSLTLKEMRQVDRALHHMDIALSHNPHSVNYHWDKALMCLLAGDLLTGFKEYEWRWKLPDVQSRTFKNPSWNGESLQGKTLFVYSEQGFGDIIHFGRYLKIISHLGGKIVFDCPEPLISLMKSISNIDIIPQGQIPTSFDYHVALISLPHILKTSLSSIPSQVPYLKPRGHIEPKALELIQKTFPKAKLKIGLAWAGKPSNKNDRFRSCPLDFLFDWMDVPDIAFYSLVKGPRENDLKLSGAHEWIPNLGHWVEDFEEMAVVMNELDLIISVDTATAHLAGAIGRPVWTMLSYNACWRYLLDRKDSPWYPTMRLFRQQQLGDWKNVIHDIKQGLLSLLS